MNKKQLKKAILFILIIFCILLINNSVQALNPDDYNPGTLQYEDAGNLFSKAVPVIKAISNIAIIGSVLAITIIGLKYMLGSTIEQKVTIKESMVPVIYGCLMIIGTFTIVRIIASISLM